MLVHNWPHLEPGIDSELETGSGYPGDPKTKNWLRQNTNKVFGLPSFARISWETSQKIMRKWTFSNIWNLLTRWKLSECKMGRSSSDRRGGVQKWQAAKNWLKTWSWTGQKSEKTLGGPVFRSKTRPNRSYCFFQSLLVSIICNLITAKFSTDFCLVSEWKSCCSLQLAARLILRIRA